MGRHVSSLWLAGLVLLPGTHARGADASRPHPHTGLLQKFERKTPDKYGLRLDNTPKDKLRGGKPLLRVLSLPGGFKRAVSVQDVPAPPEVVWALIMDLDRYANMVDGCDRCEVYRRAKTRSTQVVCAKYRISAGPFGMEYFMEHTYEPAKSCMTFHLDYSRLSEFSDTVGYWYVEKLDDGWCRVYYSADSKLPGWVPAFARDRLINLAVSQSTNWVDRQCKLAQGAGGAAAGGWRARLRRWARRAVLVTATLMARDRLLLKKVQASVTWPPRFRASPAAP